MVENIIIRDLTSGGILELSQESTPYNILDTVDWGVIDATHNQTRYVKQIGTTLISTTMGTRDIEVNAWVIARSVSQMANRKQVLNSFFNPLHDYQIEYLNYKLEVIFSNTIRWGKDKRENNEVICRWQITGVATNPLFYELESNSSASTDSLPRFKFPIKMPVDRYDQTDVVFGEIKINAVMRIINGGQVDTGMEIVIKANGTVVNPIVQNSSTGEYVLINKTLVEGEEVYINTNIGNKSVKGRIGSNNEYENYYQYRQYGSGWPQLTTGSNYYIASAESGYDNMKVTFQYARAYLEVQQCE